MMIRGNTARRKHGVMVAAALALLSVPAVAQAPELAMLASLQRGGWELRLRGDDSRQRVCLRSGMELIQLRHTQANCSRYVVEDESTRVTVQYTCPGHGYGRTTIRKESASLIQVESQGIIDGRPFHLSAEGRRSGAC
jgi:hypothetical protein